MRRQGSAAAHPRTAARKHEPEERTVNSTHDVIVLGAGAGRVQRSGARAAEGFDAAIIERELPAGQVSRSLTGLVRAGAR